MAKLVDAQDLKSCGLQHPCRFKSGLRHQQLEEYPSLVEGTGLENREVEQSAQGFESLFLRQIFFTYRGVEQLVARRAHNPKVEGPSPSSATMVP